MPTTELDRAPLRGALWALAGLLLLSSAWLLIDTLLERQVVGQHQRRLQQLAAAYTERLDRDMARRAAEVFTAADAPDLPGKMSDPAALNAVIQSLHNRDSAYSWIGILTAEGVSIATTNSILLGANTSHRPVYIEGSKAPWVGDVHDALMLAKLLPNPSGEPLRFVDFAAPIRNPDKTLAGVFTVHVGWNWAQKVRDDVLQAEKRSTDLLIISAERHLLLGRPGEIGPQPSSGLAVSPTAGTALEKWQDGRTYIVASAISKGEGVYPGLGWTILAREPLEEALRAHKTIHLWIWPAILAASIGLGALGWLRALKRSGN